MKNKQKSSHRPKDSKYSTEKSSITGLNAKEIKKKISQKNKLSSTKSVYVTLGIFAPLFSGILYSILTRLKPELFHQLPVLNTQERQTVSYGTGGWERASNEDEQLFNTSFCNIERRFAEDLSNEEFESVYRYKKPLLIRFMNGAAGWTRPEKWTKESLIREYGRWQVDSGKSDDIVKAYGNGDIQSSFVDFLRFMHDPKHKLEPLYMFDRSFYDDSDIPGTIKPPQYLEIKENLDGSIFLLGASRSGVSFHKHADAWNGVVFGRKRWFLYPPTKTPPGGVYPSFTQQDWIKKVYPNLRPDDMPTHECIQEAGEILYIPESYYHGTVNIGDTIAIGIQKKNAHLRMEMIIYEAGEIEKNIQEKQLPPDDPEVQKVLALYEELVKITPNSTESLHKLAIAYETAGQVEQAVKILEKVIEMDPLFGNARVDLGRFYVSLGNSKRAEVMFRESLKMTPGNVDANRHYASLLEKEGKYKEAAERYRTIINTKPELAIAYMSLSEMLEMSGDQKGAKTAKDHGMRLIREKEMREKRQQTQ